MIHDGLEFHNIAEFHPVEGVEGLRMQRIPESVRSQLSAGPAGVMLSPADCEIRFRLEEGVQETTLRLSSESKTTVYIYYGPFQGQTFEVTTEPVDIPVKPHKRIFQLFDLDCSEFKYSPALVRVCFGGAYPEPVMYHGHGRGVSLPQAGDAPDKTFMTYGTSITHGTGLSGAAISYPAHVAWRLGYDLRNFGASGCCLCEKPMSDYLAAQKCDLVTLELSVNMVASFTPDEFRERVGYLVEQIAKSDPDRPVFCITIFPYFRDIDERFATPDAKSTPGEFRQILREIVCDLRMSNVRLIEGNDLLPSVADLTFDLIHPGARGLVQIGEALVDRIRAAGVVD